MGPKAGVQSSRKEAGLPPSREHSQPERTCVLTRAHGSRDELIRLALGPDGQVLPDVRAKAPGRGAWIGVSRSQLDAANAKGKLKAALSRAFKTGELSLPSELGALIEAALSRDALDRLGMEARSGTLINGADRVDTAARSGKVHLLLHAADAGEDGRRKLDQAWRMGGAEERGHRHGLVIPAPRTMLSMALGRENVVHVALTDRAAATRVARALARWRAFIDPDGGLGRSDAAPAAASTDEPNEGTK
ncbi:DUF448 domain-containing protein [Sphingomonas sp. GCM10030256]|uniref:DUF448 domain-containing protein n=1 Tax=Sphingomonas sp. GCM10030256 TaxID=3273427 RepID=UPI003611601D